MADARTDPLSVVIAIPTFRRPDRLTALLKALPERIAEVSNLATVGILVIDNDPSGSAAATVQAVETQNLTYVLEREPGIAAARSRALAESAEFELLAFVDDDEIPQEGWLRELLAMRENTGASAVAGRVITDFPPDVDPWVLAGGFFRRPLRVAGARMDVAATNNLLLDLRRVRELGIDFDRQIGLAGGEDSAFTRELVRRGGTIVWCQDSVVIDPIYADRITRSALLRRSFALGNVSVRLHIAEASSTSQRVSLRARYATQGFMRVMVGSVRTAWGYATNSLPHNARGRRLLSRGAGMIAASCGIKFEEYSRS
ncbi:glycosyltransferase family 2 protein [Leucobacter salsicius]|uniref:glycosyltransferase family 2 protein n=1 Tax=Leucobacter salsicius TaxID=664638 RepID=UPI00034816BB|nr:glycosyltransferase family 2 protein [Leucobacter salsicius]